MNGTVRTVGAMLCWMLPVVSSAGAEGAWVLWARQCDVISQVCDGEWQRRGTYEAERWCQADRTRAINQGLTLAARKAARRTVVEYDCLPAPTDPGGPKGTK